MFTHGQRVRFAGGGAGAGSALRARCSSRAAVWARVAPVPTGRARAIPALVRMPRSRLPRRRRALLPQCECVINLAFRRGRGHARHSEQMRERFPVRAADTGEPVVSGRVAPGAQADQAPQRLHPAHRVVMPPFVDLKLNRPDTVARLPASIVQGKCLAVVPLVSAGGDEQLRHLVVVQVLSDRAVQGAYRAFGRAPAPRLVRPAGEFVRRSSAGYSRHRG